MIWSENSRNCLTGHGFQWAQRALRDSNLLPERRRELRELLSNPNVVKPEAVSTGRVGFGTVVIIQPENGNETSDLLVVGSFESDPNNGRISYESPLGAAFMGCAVGDVIEANLGDVKRAPLMTENRIALTIRFSRC